MILENINFKIRYGDKIGIVGKTGVVKVIIDILMGLINPPGQIFVNDLV